MYINQGSINLNTILLMYTFSDMKYDIYHMQHTKTDELTCLNDQKYISSKTIEIY